MLLVKDTPLSAAWFTWPIKPPTPSMIVVVKATYDLVSRGQCPLSAEQELPTGDGYLDDDVERAQRYETDFAILKPKGEAYLVGTCHNPGGRKAPTAVVTFRVGTIQKQLAVLGDRWWKKGLLGGMTDPVAFSSMPLDWERSFGGAGFDANPIGRGLTPDPTDPEGRVALPNLEQPSSLLKKPKERPEPAGLFPISKTHAPRIARAGTYGVRWRTSRWPWFPTDFDYGYFNATPRDQQIVGYFRGDEKVHVANVHPEHPKLDCQLPGIRPRAFVMPKAAGLPWSEVGLVCDTIVVDSDAMKIYALFRGSLEVRDAELADQRHLFVTQEQRDAPLSDEACRIAYERQLGAIAAEEQGYEAEPMPHG